MSMAHVDAEDRERRKQIAVGGGILLVITMLVCGAIYGWRLLPGVLGEWIGTMVGVMTTPFILETSFVILGFVVVIGLNIWRRHKDGDELVYLDQIVDSDLPADLPDQARWAIYREAPLAGEEPDLLSQAQGALEIGDLPAAAEIFGWMSAEQLGSPEVLGLRVRLAQMSGNLELARKLNLKLHPSSSDPI